MFIYNTILLFNVLVKYFYQKQLHFQSLFFKEMLWFQHSIPSHSLWSSRWSAIWLSGWPTESVMLSLLCMLGCCSTEMCVSSTSGAQHTCPVPTSPSLPLCFSVTLYYNWVQRRPECEGGQDHLFGSLCFSPSSVALWLHGYTECET